jgi:hypothetical protein
MTSAYTHVRQSPQITAPGHRIPPQLDRANLCRCRTLRVRFDSSHSLSHSCHPLQLQEQSANLYAGTFEVCQLVRVGGVHPTVLKKLGLLSQESAQFGADLGMSVSCHFAL